MHFQNVWRHGLMNYVECEEVRVNGIPKLTTALKARQVSFLFLVACAWRNLFPGEAMWFPSCFEFDHSTDSWHHSACHVGRERMMTWHKTAWPHFHILSGVIRHFVVDCGILSIKCSGAGTRVEEWRFPDVLWLRPHLQVLLLSVISFGFTKPLVTHWGMGRIVLHPPEWLSHPPSIGSYTACWEPLV
jgi:hypothetical protein